MSVPGSQHLASVLSLQLQFADAAFSSVVQARGSIYPVLAARAATNATPEDIETLRQSVERMREHVADSDFMIEELRRFHEIIAVASGDTVLGLLVNALHRMSEGSSFDFDEKRRRLAVRFAEKVARAIESGDPETARTVSEKHMAEAGRDWLKRAPDTLKKPVAWIDSDH